MWERLPKEEVVESLQQETTPFRVVVVDDNVDGANTLALLLETLGCKALAVHNGSAALLAVAAVDPQLLFVDLEMPGMSGADVAREVRALGGAQRYLACMTARFMSADEAAEVAAAGFDAVLIKPMEMEQIATVLGAAGWQADREKRQVPPA